MQIKTKNRNRPNYNVFSFIEVVRVRSKHTSYVKHGFEITSKTILLKFAAITQMIGFLKAAGLTIKQILSYSFQALSETYSNGY